MKIPGGFTREQLVACARREWLRRQDAYPKLVEQGRLPREKAVDGIAMMGAILAVLEALPFVAPAVRDSRSRAAGDD